MKIVVEGCCHGDLDTIYGSIKTLMEKENCQIDLLICCGDFQAVRNESDLECMACPIKYRSMQSFYKYYSGEKKAPIPTIFIGGNHEAANHLWELYHGGWVAENMYYLGHSGVVSFGGIRIGGLSGIYNPAHYYYGHFERPPYTEQTTRAAYHVKDFEVFKLKQIKQPMDIFLSHDWPQGIVFFGDKEELCKIKPFFRNEIDKNTLGNPPAFDLLKLLKPSYWFSAHLHVKFPAVVQHDDQTITKFLSLDKCLPKRSFLQVFDIEEKGPLKFTYDEEWLAIVKSTISFMPLTKNPFSIPEGRQSYSPTEEEIQEIKKILQEKNNGSLDIPFNFQRSVPTFSPNRRFNRGELQRYRQPHENPQATAFSQLLNIPNVTISGVNLSINPANSAASSGAGLSGYPNQNQNQDTHSIVNDHREDYSDSRSRRNPDEIDIDDNDNENENGNEFDDHGHGNEHEQDHEYQGTENENNDRLRQDYIEEHGDSRIGEKRESSEESSQPTKRRAGINLPPPTAS